MRKTAADRQAKNDLASLPQDQQDRVHALMDADPTRSLSDTVSRVKAGFADPRLLSSSERIHSTGRPTIYSAEGESATLSNASYESKESAGMPGYEPGSQDALNEQLDFENIQLNNSFEVGSDKVKTPGEVLWEKSTPTDDPFFEQLRFERKQLDESGPVPQFSKNISEAQKDFVRTIYSAALNAQADTGVPAAIVVAQAVHETGYGTRIPTDRATGASSNNLFGIKAVGAQASVNDGTHEIINGKKVFIHDNFAAYGSFEESVAAHSTFLATYKNYENLRGVTDVVQYAHLLQQDRYATDQDYANKLVRLMKSFKLLPGQQ